MDARLNTLRGNVLQYCQFSCVFSTQPENKTSFLNIVGKYFRTRNQSMTENTNDDIVY